MKSKLIYVEEEKSRIVYIDYLRVIATFGVVMIHVSAYNWYSIDVSSFEWQTFNFFDSISRYGVSMFVMISGALFLGKDVSLKTIYKKYVFRLVIAFGFWSFIYMLFKGGDIKSRIVNFIHGNYHMWFY